MVTEPDDQIMECSRNIAMVSKRIHIQEWQTRSRVPRPRLTKMSATHSRIFELRICVHMLPMNHRNALQIGLWNVCGGVPASVEQCLFACPSIEGNLVVAEHGSLAVAAASEKAGAPADGAIRSFQFLLDPQDDFLKGHHRNPILVEQCKINGAAGSHQWMEYRCGESDQGCLVRIVSWKQDVQRESAARIWAIWTSSDRCAPTQRIYVQIPSNGGESATLQDFAALDILELFFQTSQSATIDLLSVWTSTNKVNLSVAFVQSLRIVAQPTLILHH